jgi:bifunctional UDP-N-acetylglucosamine pyrophosphorylase/glucosamine-1-phosphate N-acetyltransferase
MNLTCVILAAGKGTRMKSKKAKVLHEICFKPLLHYPIQLAYDLNCKNIIVVAGYQEDKIKERFSGYNNITYAIQKEQLGTGHAVTCAFDKLDESDGDILIICGDSPFLSADTISTLYGMYKDNAASVSILTATADDPANYGRIVKDAGGNFIKIVEEKDADDKTREIKEINTGTYIVNRNFLSAALKKVKNENSQKEYYLTDITSIAVNEGKKVVTYKTDNFFQAMGINTKEELATAGRIRQREINKRFMLSGVTIIDPDTSYIEDGVVIEADAVIYPGVMITGNTIIREGASIHNGCIINDSAIGKEANILPYSVIEKSVIEDNTSIGPFARLRPDTVIKKGAKIGNFVEIKKSVIDEGAKAGHLTYIGDSSVGKNVNIGAGTITCNYDGVKKHKTVIEDNVFIGSNAALVAPVTIKKGALVGAGAVITKDVPEGTVAVERSLQKHYKKTKKDK